GHGTHVLGIAGGNGRATGSALPARPTDPVPQFTYVGVAPRADLAMVCIGKPLSTGVPDGVGFIFKKATELGKPAAVNVSLGSQPGPHAGTSGMDVMLDRMMGPGRVVVKSAGNDNGKHLHARVAAPAAAGSSVTLVVTDAPPAGEGRRFSSVRIVGFYDPT